MGRLFHWINHVSRIHARPRGRALRGGVARRPLGFEKYESRLALSAATQTMVADEAGFAGRAEFLQNLWLNSPGTVEWSRVVYQPSQSAADAAGFVRPFVIEFAVSPGQLAASKTMAEGGLISMDAASADLNLNSLLSNVSQRFVRAAFNADGAGLTVTDGVLTLADNDVAVPQTSWNLENAGSWNWELDSKGYENYLGADDLAPSVDGQMHVESTPILRITIPVKPTESEGGTIDLTAMAGPTSLQIAAPSSSLVARDAGQQGDAAQLQQATARPAASSPIEGLRARAVVYEVAFNRQATPANAVRANEIDRMHPAEARTDAAPPHARASARPRDTVPSARQGHEEASTSDNHAQRPEVMDSIKTLPPAPSDRSAAPRAAAAIDGAFSAWGDSESKLVLDAERDDRLMAMSREQQVGLAVAVVVGAGPLVKRVRRTTPKRVVEQAAGLE